MSNKPNVPRIPNAFFKWYCKGHLYEELHGDLEEFFYERAEENGLFKARLHYLWDVLRCFQPYAWKNTLGFSNSNLAMFKNFYFTTIRNLLKHKSYFLINVSGLAIGIASFTFISLFIINELSYDRSYASYENIYRVSNESIIRGEPNESATSSSPMAAAMLDKYPQVRKATRILKVRQLLIGKGLQKINEDDILFADSSLFSVFDFNLTQGNSKTALAHPRSMVLTESYARKYFGDKDPIGKEISVDEDSVFYKITGVVEDAPPNSHIQFNMIGSLNSKGIESTTRWVGSDVHTYVVLDKGTDALELEGKMKDIFYEHMAHEIEYYTGLTISEWENANNSVGFALTPITDIHLRSTSSGELEPTGNITYIYMYGLIGITMLLIAIFNFVNLATAHSATRAKEVGVRKVIGSTKRVLMYQFILESILVSFVATLLGVVLIAAFTPSFISLVGKDLAFGLTSNYEIWLGLSGLAVLIGLLAGCYPSFVLSSFQPAQVLKGNLHAGGKAGWLRNLLVTVQFAASIVIIVGTLVVYNQIDFMLDKNLGFNKDQVIVLKRPDWLNKNLDSFKNDLLKHPNIQAVANSETLPGKTYQIRSYRRKDDAQTFLFQNNQIAYEYMDMMGFEMVAGRFFSKNFSSDSNAVVLNESAAKALGYDDPIGKPLTSAFKSGTITIIGVVKDYNIESLHKDVGPVSLELSPNVDNGYISVRMNSTQNQRETMAFLENTWDKHSNSKPFQYFFYDQEYENLYKSETSTGRVLLVFSALCIFIACLGLIGLISYTAVIRKKEIGIRKVLGADTGTLIRLLSSQIIRLILIATLISWPVAYLATDYWLQNFADHISISPWMYVGSTLGVLLVVGLAISYQTIKASMSDPIDSLRQD